MNVDHLSLPTRTDPDTSRCCPEHTGGRPLGLCEQRPVIHSLYVHVPFCFHKCHYCDFYTVIDADGDHRPNPPHDGPADRQALFVQRLIRELDHRASQVQLQPQTVFIGGGTPTLLRIHLWHEWLTALHRIIEAQRVQEFTVEANPETVTVQLLDVLAHGGVNRLSIGAQSFQRSLLQTLERWHEPAKVGQAVRAARAAGITNVNLDLIFAIPGQTLAQLDADLDAALALDPQHLSCYGLTYEPNTALTRRWRSGQVAKVSEDLERRMYAHVMDRLAAEGYEHYEISNWARPGRRCAHNLAYWLDQNWLAIGPSGASHVAGHRWRNASHLGRYLSDAIEPPITEQEHLAEDDRIGEQLMLRLRLTQGVPRCWLADHLIPDDRRHVAIEHLTELGMLHWQDDHLRLTRRGIFVADTVLADLL